MNSLQTIRSVSRGYRHAKRLQQILSILVKNGFGYLFENLTGQNLLGMLPFRKQRHDVPAPSFFADAKNSKRLLNTLCELGPTFVKFGQMLSCRPDLLPDELIQALSKLRTQVPPLPFETVRKLLQEELGHPIEELFSSFDENSAGSASIAQGYRAVLKDGRKVFVKLQRPGILSGIQADLDILGILAANLENSFPELAVVRPGKLVEDFRDGLLEELDFRNEAANMRAFRSGFAEEKGILLPEPIQGCCTRRVLTMTFIDGTSFNDLEKILKSGIDCQALANLGVQLLLRQFFEMGFFHGDPHPGNMFCLPGPRIAYIDFGVMGRLTLHERTLLKKCVADMFMGDMHAMARDVAELSDFQDQLDQEGLERELATLVDSHMKGSVRELNVVQFVLDFHKLCRRQRLYLKPHFGRMMRALAYADAMGRELAPDFNILETLKPFIRKQSLEQLNPAKNLKEAWHCLNDWGILVQQAPLQLQRILQQFRDGTFTILQKQEDIRFLATRVDTASRRLASALVVAAVILAAAIIAAAILFLKHY